MLPQCKTKVCAEGAVHASGCRCSSAGTGCTCGARMGVTAQMKALTMRMLQVLPCCRSCHAVHFVLPKLWPSCYRVTSKCKQHFLRMLIIWVR